jgi:putative tricarboxylic transport membrane protein
MKSFTWRGNTDFYSGVLLIVVAAVALSYIGTLAVGTVTRMGPGYFPFGLAVILLGMGLVLVVKGLATAGTPVGRFYLRPLVLILLSFAVFGFLIERAGIIVAILAQVAIAHFASRETILRQSVITGVAVAAVSAVVFVVLLKIPVKLLP